jgi:5-methylcytosine-specific restriction endonuclease McrA
MSVTIVPLKLRAALWSANDRKCFYCEAPLAFKDLEVDHVIPRSLSRHRLKALLTRLSLPQSFDLNSSPNLVPTHHRCNRRKSDALFADKPIAYFLGLWAKKQRKVQRELAAHKQAADRDHHLEAIAQFVESGELTKNEVLQLLGRVSPKAKPRNADPTVVTFSANAGVLIGGRSIPCGLKRDYPKVCDWLEKKLFGEISKTLPVLSQPTEASARNGETLSVRVAFWNLDLDRLDTMDVSPWSIEEVCAFSALYDSDPTDLLAKAVVNAHALVVGDESDPLFGIGRCPRCGSTNLRRASGTSPFDGDVYHTISCNDCNWGGLDSVERGRHSVAPRCTGADAAAIELSTREQRPIVQRVLGGGRLITKRPDSSEAKKGRMSLAP